MNDTPFRTEPNNDSPLNAQAAGLWANQEGVCVLANQTHNHKHMRCCRHARIVCASAEYRKVLQKKYAEAK